jgi:hypothetical protein
LRLRVGWWQGRCGAHRSVESVVRGLGSLDMRAGRVEWRIIPCCLRLERWRYIVTLKRSVRRRPRVGIVLEAWLRYGMGVTHGLGRVLEGRWI